MGFVILSLHILNSNYNFFMQIGSFGLVMELQLKGGYPKVPLIVPYFEMLSGLNEFDLCGLILTE